MMVKGFCVHSFLTLLLVLLVEGTKKEGRCKSPTPIPLEACTSTKDIPEFPLKPAKKPANLLYPDTVFTLADGKPAPEGFKSSFSTPIATIPMKGAKSCDAGCLFLSTTEGFLPQMKLYKVLDKANYELVAGVASEDTKQFKYPMLEGQEYLIEVGLDSTIVMPKAFPVQLKGTFMVVLTGSLTSLLGYFGDEIILGSIGGWSGTLPVQKNGTPFMVSSGNPKVAPISGGSLSMAHTPYYDRQGDSITLYYTNGSTYGGCSAPRATRFAFKCGDKKRDEKIFAAEELTSRCSYEGDAESRNICKLVRFLDGKFK